MAVGKGLGAARTGGSPDPAAVARDSIDALTSGLDAVTTNQTVIGARLAWIDLTTERRIDLGEMRAGEEKEIGATDMADAVARLQEVMLALEASQASFAKLAKLSLFDVVG